MAIQYFIGGTSGAFGTAGNWLSGAVPSDGDTIIGDERATQSLATGLTVAGKAFPLVVFTRGYRFSLGSVGNEFEPENGIGKLIWEATGADSQCHCDTEIDDVYIDSPARGVGVVLQCTAAGEETTNLHLKDGLVTLGANFNFVNSSFVTVEGGRLVIASGVTMGTGNKIVLAGGEIITEQTLIEATLKGGTLNLNGAAAAALIKVMGSNARFNWRSTGTVTRHEGYDGISDAYAVDLPRTLTDGLGMNPHQFLAGHGLIVTNGWQRIGSWNPTYPHGVVLQKV